MESICDYIANSIGTVDIENNSPGCNSPVEVEISCWTSVEELAYNEDYIISPNPAQSCISIKNIDRQTKFRLFNSSGVTLKKGIISTSNKISLKDLAKGLYFIELENDMNTTVKKIIKN